jgi:hypothetical protein
MYPFVLALPHSQLSLYEPTKPEEKVLKFVNKKWLPYANKALRKIAA